MKSSLKKSKAASCLICGEELQYLKQAERMECAICHTAHMSNAKCKENHFICDTCHSKKGIEVIKETCLQSASKNPIDLARKIMTNPFIYMHGPEHHIMVGACLLTAYANCGGDLALESALDEMELRGKQVPGGFCGLHGCCGAAISTGIYYSIITKCTPLHKEDWQKANLMTATALSSIAKHGGPRCCKRNSFLAMQEAIDYTAKNKNIFMQAPLRIVCGFYMNNNECLEHNCTFHPTTVSRA